MSAGQVMAEIGKDMAFYEESGRGDLFRRRTVLSAGLLEALLLLCRSEEIHTAVDTCGAVSWEVLDRLRLYVNLFLYDLR
jgi:pyruvate formate lyase activating enzyme